MSAFAISTHSINDSFAEFLRPFTAKQIAAKIQLPSWRTVENWKERKSSPQAKHIAAMLQDADLAPAALAAMGRRDLAAAAEIESLNQRIEALKNAERQHERKTNEIRRDLATGRQRSGMASGPAQPRRDSLEEDRGVVSRQAD